MSDDVCSNCVNGIVSDERSPRSCGMCNGTGVLTPERREHLTNPIKPEIQALCDRGNITLSEMQSLRCNSWEWELVLVKLDNEALIHQAEHFIANCQLGNARRPFTVYNDAVCGLVAPLLIERLKAALANIEDLGNRLPWD